MESSAKENIQNDKGLHLDYYPQFYSERQCDEIISNLQKLTYRSDEESSVVVRGKRIKIPRQQTAFADPNVRSYRFAGTSVGGSVWPDFLMNVREQIREQTNIDFNYILVNYYENGNNYIGYHHDDVRDLEPIGKEHIIASLSFGATRDFLLKHVGDKSVYKLPLQNGDLLLMRDDTNKKYKHSVPKRLRVAEPRWNLTFRKMKVS